MQRGVVRSVFRPVPAQRIADVELIEELAGGVRNVFYNLTSNQRGDSFRRRPLDLEGLRREIRNRPGLQQGDFAVDNCPLNVLGPMVLAIDDDQVEWEIKRGALRLNMIAHRGHGGILKAPTISGMDGRIVESMNSSVEVRLSRKTEIIFSGTGTHCGLEAAGEIDRLLRMQKQR